MASRLLPGPLVSLVRRWQGSSCAKASCCVRSFGVKAREQILLVFEVDIIEGDMHDKDVVVSAAQGARYVIHLAADYRLWSPHDKDIMRANVEGTRVVMEAARAAGAERIVYTSSVATLKLRDDGAPADETTPLAEEDASGATSAARLPPSGWSSR